jgi:hypothetical protein
MIAHAGDIYFKYLENDSLLRSDVMRSNRISGHFLPVGVDEGQFDSSFGQRLYKFGLIQVSVSILKDIFHCFPFN